jgi:hypothetical protein
VAFIKITRFLKIYFQRNGRFNKKSEAFLKITRLFDDIYNGIEAIFNYTPINRGFYINVGRFERFGGFFFRNVRLFREVKASF